MVSTQIWRFDWELTQARKLGHGEVAIMVDKDGAKHVIVMAWSHDWWRWVAQG